jgi:hypothetical protein
MGPNVSPDSSVNPPSSANVIVFSGYDLYFDTCAPLMVTRFNQGLLSGFAVNTFLVSRGAGTEPKLRSLFSRRQFTHPGIELRLFLFKARLVEQ